MYVFPRMNKRASVIGAHVTRLLTRRVFARAGTRCPMPTATTATRVGLSVAHFALRPPLCRLAELWGTRGFLCSQLSCGLLHLRWNILLRDSARLSPVLWLVDDGLAIGKGRHIPGQFPGKKLA